MILLIVLGLIYLCFMLFPFMVAFSANNRGGRQMLLIRHDNEKDPRFFSKRFREMMKRAGTLPAGNPPQGIPGTGSVSLSVKERYCTPPFFEEEVDAIVYATEPFDQGKARVFKKEIYSLKDTRIRAGTTLRAVASEGRLRIEKDSVLGRWADAEEDVEVEDGVYLGVSLTSAKNIHIGTGCRFRRLFGRAVSFGTLKIKPRYTTPPKDGGRYFDPVYRTEQDLPNLLEGDVVFTGHRVIPAATAIEGSVKGHGSVHVGRGTSINGNLFSNGDVVLEQNVFVAGNIFSQENVLIGPGCQIGTPNRVKSVIARKRIVVSEGAVVYGYLSCERGGCSVTEQAYEAETCAAF